MLSRNKAIVPIPKTRYKSFVKWNCSIYCSKDTHTILIGDHHLNDQAEIASDSNTAFYDELNGD